MWLEVEGGVKNEVREKKKEERKLQNMRRIDGGVKNIGILLRVVVESLAYDWLW